jgi:phospholipase/lecithinase/hemolysin
MGDPTLISEAVDAIYSAADELYDMGARKFVFATAPNIGGTWALKQLGPTVAGLATVLSKRFNAALVDMIAVFKNEGHERTSVKTLDVFGTFNRILNHPKDFHLSNVTDTCVTPLIEPYDCKKPDRYFFWDGIHPTKAVHGIFANEAITLILGTKQGHYH